MAEPWCQFYLFESREAMKKPRTIAADQFIVTQSSQRAEFALSAVSRFDVAASGASFTLARTRNGGDAGFKSMATTLKLHSDKQPQLVELKCTVYANPFHYNFVSVNKIQEILAPIASLQFE